MLYCEFFVGIKHVNNVLGVCCKLVYHVRDLQALVIIFKTSESASGVFVFQIIASVLLGIKTFVFDLPAVSSCQSNIADIIFSHFHAGQIYKPGGNRSCIGSVFVLSGNGFGTAKPVYSICSVLRSEEHTSELQSPM